MNLHWVTSFAVDMLKDSGKPLVESFVRTQTAGTLFVMAEGVKDLSPLAAPNVLPLPLERSEMLRKFLATEADWIPKHLGGKHHGHCQCPGGPYGPHDKKHTMPCIGQWFCRNASRWFRKQAALQMAGDYVGQTRLAKGKPADDAEDVWIWVDADCRFERRIPSLVVRSWFVDQAALFYHRDKRDVLEAGVVGYWPSRGAHKLINWVFECFMSGRWHGLSRWDDCYALQKAMEKNPDVRCVDIACGVGDNAKVIDFGPVGPWIRHDKGRHGRKLNIMK